MRRPYERGRLTEEDLAPTWLGQLEAWLEDAASAGLPEPNAMVLATADRNGRPSARTVLLKGLDEGGLTFFTNLRSRKGRELQDNPRAALVFPWSPIERQVVIDGHVEALEAAESDRYFRSRPLGAPTGCPRQPAVAADRARRARAPVCRPRGAPPSRGSEAGMVGRAALGARSSRVLAGTARSSPRPTALSALGSGVDCRAARALRGRLVGRQRLRHGAQIRRERLTLGLAL